MKLKLRLTFGSTCASRRDITGARSVKQSNRRSPSLSKDRRSGRRDVDIRERFVAALREHRERSGRFRIEIVERTKTDRSPAREQQRDTIAADVDRDQLLRKLGRHARCNACGVGW